MWYFIAGIIVGLMLNYGSSYVSRWESRRKIQKMSEEFEALAISFKVQMDEVMKQREAMKDRKNSPLFYTPGDHNA